MSSPHLCSAHTGELCDLFDRYPLPTQPITPERNVAPQSSSSQPQVAPVSAASPSFVLAGPPRSRAVLVQPQAPPSDLEIIIGQARRLSSFRRGLYSARPYVDGRRLAFQSPPPIKIEPRSPPSPHWQPRTPTTPENYDKTATLHWQPNTPVVSPMQLDDGISHSEDEVKYEEPKSAVEQFLEVAAQAQVVIDQEEKQQAPPQPLPQPQPQPQAQLPWMNPGRSYFAPHPWLAGMGVQGRGRVAKYKAIQHLCKHSQRHRK